MRQNGYLGHRQRPGHRTRRAGQAKARHRNLAKGWIDGGYANPVDSGVVGRAARELRIDLEVVERSDDVKGFAVIPWRRVVERTNGHRTPTLRQ